MDANNIDNIFLTYFPLGLDDPKFIALGKKHQSSSRILRSFENEFTLKNLLSKDKEIQQKSIEWITKQVSASTMISTFEKVAFRNYMIDKSVYPIFLKTLYNLLKENNNSNFSDFVDVLSLKKHEKNSNIAKWPIITFFLLYYNVNEEIFVKPTTIKALAKALEYDIKYTSLPSYDCYIKIKKMVLDYKSNSKICCNQNNIITQAVLYTVIA